jgi:di/tricarboxylate transporter
LKKILISIAVALLIILIKPLGMDLNQSILIAGFTLTIIWWTSGIVDKTYASIFLLVIFVIFGQTPIKKVFHFPLSETFITLIFSFLFSQGISNSKLADKLLQPVLFKYAKSLPKLLISIFIIQIAMIFIIPQPFSRVIIISIILTEFFNKIDLEDRTKEVLLFWLYASSVHVNMFMIRGDIILNNALMTIASYPLDEFTWMQYMLVPSFIFYLLVIGGFLLVFKKDLKKYNVKTDIREIVPEKLDKKEKLQLFIIISIVVAWAAESVHGISGTAIVVTGTIIMFLMKLLGRKDLKTVNVKLLIFLTAAFSIGNVLRTSGTSDILFSGFINMFPKEFNIYYVFFIFLTSAGLHMVFGSNMTTLSVVIPGLLTIGSGLVKTEIMMFIIYFSVCSHYVLPFHNVIMMIGDGNRHYRGETMLKFAPALTGVVTISILFIYMNWWRVAGLL